ncbi:hypothetical protein [Intestinimonas butyriciproducens]|uniref:hypothetical protein n=1 Tax=Intestinimonas butyriciproducens TaxID=1297617 RepID=UPI000951B3BA|nr:hypothetical protein [Intestinimonas butyriciproducens]OLR68381.1 hypothetical protein BIV19_12755 [Intestinimonas butyriciproducens]
MKELNFESGLVTYSLNGKCEVTFNPTDGQFAKKILDVFNALESKQEERNGNTAENGEEAFAMLQELDTEMRGMIDNLFGVPVCEPLFGDMNVYALNNDGIPLWMVLLLMVMGEIKTNIDKNAAGDVKAKLEKYVGKYMKNDF